MSVAAASFAPGSGYGVDANEGAGTRLGLLFASTGFLAQDFELMLAGDSLTFAVGSLQLVEANSSGGINTNEVDNLGINATLDFGAPFAAPILLFGSGSATAGSVSDAAVDLTITWDPLQLAFGAGGLLGITMNPLAFASATTLAQTVTVTLLNAPAVAAPSTVPEPGSLALLGAAWAGLGVARRRRPQRLEAD